MRPRLMFVVNVDWFFLSHRLRIAQRAMNEGYEVHIACGTTGREVELARLGLVTHPLKMTRGHAGPFSTLKVFFDLFVLFRRVKPDLVHLVTIKPVLLGGMAARLAGVSAVVAAVSGLGFVFTGEGILAAVRRLFVGFLYRLALGHKNLNVIFQNPDDRDTLRRITRLALSQTSMIRGSGVDLYRYQVASMPELPIVMLAARLLKDKGVLEFVEASNLLIAQGCSARFVLVGTIDPENPASLTQQEIAEIRKQRKVEVWGHRENMPEVLASATIVVLPSYREGLPKVLLEAAACGRAVITADVPGCRDAIEPGVTGLLVPARNAFALADAIGHLLDDAARCKALGDSGRRLAEREFDVEQVAARHMQIYSGLLASRGL
jgi:glycosyltransferase involved in cell wall biosynthesis